MPLCGGSWNNSSNAGVFNVNLNNPRANSNSNIGFRSALPSYARIGMFTNYRQCEGIKESTSPPDDIPEKNGTVPTVQTGIGTVVKAMSMSYIRKSLSTTKIGKGNMRIKNIFDLIFSDENLYEALQDASKGRRYHKHVLQAQYDCWDLIARIQNDVRSGNYEIDRHFIFYVYEPKKRMIMSISFYHRIVQWAIYRVINPLLVKGYIKDSYGCIPGRGALSAMKRLRYWLQSAERKSGTWYYLKLDISKYFYRISHEVLREILAKKIKDKRLLNVLFSVIDCKHTPFGLPPGKGPGDVPLEERLYDVGMPVGNLLSQVFANVYLDVLDQFCKRVLGIHCYVRYMDDIIILSDSKEQLHEWKYRIQMFLEEELRLSLNQKTCIRPISQGIEFVGYRIWPHYVTIRKSTTLQIKRAMRLKMHEYSIDETSLEDVTNTLKCYLGMLDHCDCRRFRDELICSTVLVRGKRGKR